MRLDMEAAAPQSQGSNRSQRLRSRSILKSALDQLLLSCLGKSTLQRAFPRLSELHREIRFGSEMSKP